MRKHALLFCACWVGCLVVASCGADTVAVADAAVVVDAAPAIDAVLLSDAGGDAGSGLAVCGDGVVEGLELCEGSAQINCVELAAVWSSGKAVCKSDCSGYDVNNCTLGSQTTEAVYPAERDPRFANALCNDGTPFVFEVSMAPLRTSKWLVFFEGGGLCDGTYNRCVGRPVNLTTSSAEPPDRSASFSTQNPTLMSRDPAVNPSFYDANYAFARYCSSDIWVGTNATPQPIMTRPGIRQWVFTGRNNARAMVAMLFGAYGLDDRQSELLVSGNSAGGAGAFLNIDLFAERMPLGVAARRVALLVSAAWENPFWDDPSYTFHGLGLPGDTVGAAIYATYQSEANPRCVAVAASMGLPPWACRGGPLTYTAATAASPVGYGVRTFVAKNRLDQGSMNDYEIPYADDANAQDQAARATWLTQITDSMQGILWLYAPADPQDNQTDDNLHGLAVDSLVWPYQPPGHPGQSLKEMIARFWADRDPDAAGERVLYEGDVPHTE